MALPLTRKIPGISGVVEIVATACSNPRVCEPCPVGRRWAGMSCAVVLGIRRPERLHSSSASGKGTTRPGWDRPVST